MPAFDVARRWKGRVVLDRTGDKLGSVLDVFYDAENDEPGWVLLGTVGVGDGTRFVPVAEAVEHGNELRVPYDRAFEGAPGMEPGATRRGHVDAASRSHAGSAAATTGCSRAATARPGRARGPRRQHR